MLDSKKTKNDKDCKHELDGRSNVKSIKYHLESLKSEADSDENAGGQADIDSTFQGGVQHWNIIGMIEYGDVTLRVVKLD